jgi:serine/threonine-protein kinase
MPPAGETLGWPITGTEVAISPDGRRVVFITAKLPRFYLYVRALDQLEAQPLQVLGDFPQHLFMSPDGNWVGFFDEPDLLGKVALNGGPAARITNVKGGARGASWGADDTIVFATDDPATGLLRVPAAGGQAEVLTTPDAQKGELDHVFPELLPGGDAILFTIVPRTGGIDAAQIAVRDLRTGEQKILVAGGSSPRYVSTGHIVYGVAGTLRAVAFDLDRLEVQGNPVPVLQRVYMKPVGSASFGVSRDGSLVYLAGVFQGGAAVTLVWVDRQGREEVISAPPRVYRALRISPDGTRVAVQEAGDIWIWDFTRQALMRFTFDAAESDLPVWTPDGQRLVFSSEPGGSTHRLFWRLADGTGPVQQLMDNSSNDQYPTSFSPDGTRLLFTEYDSSTGFTIRVLPLKGDRTLASSTTLNGQNAEVSPDGRWLAYQSNESGQSEVYVRPFPQLDGGRWQVSTGGGTEPVWARSGKELFYEGLGGAMMSVAVDGGSAFRAGNPTRLFEWPYLVAAQRTYDVSPDGQRFLEIKPFGPQVAPTSLVVVQHWFEELKRLVPSR